jgi:hypothetical protein
MGANCSYPDFGDAYDWRAITLSLVDYVRTYDVDVPALQAELHLSSTDVMWLYAMYVTRWPLEHRSKGDTFAEYLFRLQRLYGQCSVSSANRYEFELAEGLIQEPGVEDAEDHQ